MHNCIACRIAELLIIEQNFQTILLKRSRKNSTSPDPRLSPAEILGNAFLFTCEAQHQQAVCVTQLYNYLHNIQLGQPSVNPPKLVLEVGGLQPCRQLCL